MRKIILLATLLVGAAANMALGAADVMPAPLPGPYQFMKTPQQAFAPQTRQPYWMQTPNQQVVPYWMQNAPQPFVPANSGTVPNGGQSNATANAQAGGRVQGGFEFGGQAGGNSAINQGYGQRAGPGNFPGYGGVPQAMQNTIPQPRGGFSQPQRAPNYQAYQAAPYSPQQGWNGPWGNNNWGFPWGGPSFGQWGPSGPTGYGVPNG